MSGTLLVVITVGFAGVLQAGLNRWAATHWGLPLAVFINAVMFLAAAVGYLLLARYGSWSLPDVLADKNAPMGVAWWVYVPGLLGFAFVVGVPLGISRLGAVMVFVALVAAQVVGGMVWDKFVEGIPINQWRVMAALLSIASVSLLAWSEK